MSVGIYEEKFYKALARNRNFRTEDDDLNFSLLEEYSRLREEGGSQGISGDRIIQQLIDMNLVMSNRTWLDSFHIKVRRLNRLESKLSRLSTANKRKVNENDINQIKAFLQSCFEQCNNCRSQFFTRLKTSQILVMYNDYAKSNNIRVICRATFYKVLNQHLGSFHTNHDRCTVCSSISNESTTAVNSPSNELIRDIILE